MRTLAIIAIFFSMLVTHSLHAQENTNKSGIELLDSLIAESSFDSAEKSLNRQIETLIAENRLDSLIYYPYYIGKITLERAGSAIAVERGIKFLDKIEKIPVPKRVQYEAYNSLISFYDEIGDLNRSLNTTHKALDLVLKIQNATAEEIGKMEYNLGVCYLSLGEVEKSKLYFEKARINYESYAKTTKQNLSDAYNALGATMWMSSKLDSAKIFYDKAISSVLEREGDSIENLFQATSIRSNTSLVAQSQGKLTTALSIQKKVIDDYTTVIDNVKDTEIRENARQNQLIAIYNLSTFYMQIGNLSKARDFITYSFALAKSVLDVDDPELPRYQIALGEVELSLRNFDTAIALMNEGILGLERIAIDDPFWKGKAAYGLAKGYWYKEDLEQANHYFETSEDLFSRALGDSYDASFLGLLREKAVFLAQTGRTKAAIESAKRGKESIFLQSPRKYRGGVLYFKRLSKCLDMGRSRNNTYRATKSRNK